MEAPQEATCSAKPNPFVLSLRVREELPELLLLRRYAEPTHDTAVAPACRTGNRDLRWSPEQAREGGASYLCADREAWPCERGIHNGGRPPCRHEARLCPRPVAQRAGPLKSKLAAERPPLEHSSKPRCSKDQATLQGTDFRNL